jgi:hypothetical protein
MFAISALCLQSQLFGEERQVITKADQITYEWLVNQGNLAAYSDHVVHFKKIFELLKVKTFLEFGLGFSTKYFLDQSQKVISVEFVTNGYGPAWLKDCLNLYRDCSNWIPIAFFSGYQGDMSWAPYKYVGSESVYKAASHQCSQHNSYAAIDGFYLKELDSFIENLFKCHNITVAFVDPGFYLRGDLVQLLFGKSSVIVAHDTRVRAEKIKDDVYGYTNIVTPDNYEEIFLSHGQGTTVWVLKTDQTKKFIEQMKEYAHSLISP